MELNFNKQVTGLSGQPLEGENNAMNKILATSLAYSTAGPATKFMDWAREIYNGGAINVDRTDSEVLEHFIKEHQSLPNLTKVQLLEVIQNARVQTIPAAR